MGKGNRKRPPQISREEEYLRYALAFGMITFQQFEYEYKRLKKAGKIYKRPRYKLNESTEKKNG